MNSSSNDVPTYSLINSVERKSAGAVNNSGARFLSDNDKADLIYVRLERHAIALEVLSKHGLIEEYKKAVMSPGKDPEPVVTKEVVVSCTSNE
jgi:hypothetical protein